jgi:excisionase family DNA binding protein
MAPRYLSTGQAAKVCSVTPDTILKWIRSGRLPARRTAGGHHRVDPRDLDKVVQEPSVEDQLAKWRDEPRHFRYCWEHKGQGGLLDGCKQCVVYELRAQRCYEVVKLAPEMGHSKLFCKGTCDDCDYYQHVRGQATNVLVVSNDAAMEAVLRNSPESADLNLEFVDCEYACSAAVEVFRPDFAVVDCTVGADFASDITSHLSQDPRIPFVRIILAGNPDDFPADCSHLVFARIAKPFGVQDLVDCTSDSNRLLTG